ncbi:MAG: M10 family metallopeptidase domain-containing protein [Gaiellaceae bacterium MAG52_C11]|nr:M10 family metallopeptidase domain-containing protein [Candidatus Gaiellasilicea maunaloa]
MATLSVRQIAQNCLGKTGNLSVNSDVYGYVFRDADGSVFGTLGGNDTFPGSGQPTTRSLRRHLETISGDATDLVLILVGHENDFVSGVTDRDDVTKVQYAVQVMRDLYAQVDVGIRRLNWQRIPLADAGGYVDIADGSEAEDLTDDWNGPNGGIDVFWVQTVGVAAGWSNTNGPCDKDSKDGRTGAVLELLGSRRFTGILAGHEVGHYLGLGHTSSVANMMGDDSDGDGIGSIDSNSTAVSVSEGNTMRSHCSVNGPC